MRITRGTAYDLGACNFCDRQVTEFGTTRAPVTEIATQYHSNALGSEMAGGTSTRICDACIAELIASRP